MNRTHVGIEYVEPKDIRVGAHPVEDEYVIGVGRCAVVIASREELIALTAKLMEAIALGDK